MLTTFAHEAGRASAAALTKEEQKSWGQFMTPPAIATFMARRLVADVDRDVVRILEPASGAGILAAAVVEELLANQHKPRRIELLMCEFDARLLPTLEVLAERMRAACAGAGVELDCKVQHGDFLLSELALNGQPIDNLLVISNPPYFKLPKSDSRAQAHRYAVYGQPNIYGLFMAACSRLVAPGGKWCFITPRSWMNGSYFSAVRRTLFQNLRVDSLHAFESRKEHFEEDAVLQEAVIVWATGRADVAPVLDVVITRSQGVGDLADAEVHARTLAQLIGDDEHQTLSLPMAGGNPLENLHDTLDSLGLRVSTGPVIAFRAAAHTRETGSSGTVPLLWLQHVKLSGVQWPIRKKREHIKANAESAWMLVPNTPMVLLRRFSPKEDHRRVTATAYLGHLPGPVIGLENHLNYIYRPGGALTNTEVRGLAAYLVSSVVDVYFRAVAGSTQVNASELRKLPFPSMKTIVWIGEALAAEPSLADIDSTVAAALGLEHRQVAAIA